MYARTILAMALLRTHCRSQMIIFRDDYNLIKYKCFINDIYRLLSFSITYKKHIAHTIVEYGSSAPHGFRLVYFVSL